MRDLYNREAKILSVKQKFKEACPNCFQIVEKFEHQLELNNYSIGRIEKYWSFLKTIHKSMDTCFDKADKEDIERLVISIGTGVNTRNNKKWSECTKSDFKIIAKFFFRWLINKTLDGDYPELVKWINPKIKNNRQEVPKQVLIKEEVELLANNTNNPRDRALILILYESGCRIGELLGIKIKDISFDQFGCSIMVSGKTGSRRVRVIDYSKDLLNWLDMHPLKDDPESYVWINLETLKDVISPNAVNQMLKNTAKKCKITKPVHPHFFRHSRATYLFKTLPEAIVKELFGWVKDSKMASVYNHLSGKDVDEALLKLHGIKTEEMQEVKNIGIKICQRCGENNSILSHFCKKCSSPLDLKMMLEMDETRKEYDGFVRDFLLVLVEKYPRTKKIFNKMVKERKLEHLFSGSE